jgi:mannose-6-phosphate isomerase-like protein (cupin superfamily)
MVWVRLELKSRAGAASLDETALDWWYFRMIDKASAKHYSWGSECDGWRLVSDPSLSVIEERMPPGTAEVRHFHRAARQFFYVLRGRLAFEADGREFELAAGQGLEVAPGIPHRVFNRSEADTEFLVVSSPSSQGDRVVVELETEPS